MRGTPQKVAQEAERLVKTCYADGGYVFNTGEMNPRDVPVENMKALVRGARNAGAEPR
jgi:uroporphyrinogen-III decarboxylase